MEHYIRLLTTNELNDEQIEDWVETVMQFAPDGTVVEFDEDIDEVEGDCEECGDPDFPNVYIVYLTRHLQRNEAEFIVSAWDYRYEDDYEIEISFLYRPDEEYTDPVDLAVDDEFVSEVNNHAAKFIHNRWVEAKLIEGWRYGTSYNPKELTHPGLRDWDSLPASYRKYPQLTEKEALDFYLKNGHLFK